MTAYSILEDSKHNEKQINVINELKKNEDINK